MLKKHAKIEFLRFGSKRMLQGMNFHSLQNVNSVIPTRVSGPPLNPSGQHAI